MNDKMHIIINTEATNGKVQVPVYSLNEAKQVWENHRNGDNDLYEYLGASQMRAQCCDVFQHNQLIATISYNGKIRCVQ